MLPWFHPNAPAVQLHRQTAVIQPQAESPSRRLLPLHLGKPVEDMLTLGCWNARPIITNAYQRFLLSAAAVGYAGQVASFAARLIMPQHTMEVLDQSSSVVGIAAMASEAASSGVWDFLNIAAAISMSLGFMNLLPIPPLDGGKILVELIQLALRRELSLKVQNAISYVGLAFFLFVFVFVLRNDILRLL